MTYPQPFNNFGGATIIVGDPSYFYYNTKTDKLHYSRPAGSYGWPPAEGKMSQTTTINQNLALNISMSYFPGPAGSFDVRLTVDGTTIFEHTYSTDGSDWGGSVVHFFTPGEHTIEFYFKSPYGDGYTYGGFEIEIGITNYSQLGLHPTVSALPNPVYSGDNSRVTVHVDADVLGPLSDVDLNISTVKGNLDQTSTITDILGESKLIYSAPIVYSQDIDTITANATKIGYINGTGSTKMTIVPTLIPILIVSLSKCPDQIKSGEQSEITIHVTNNNNTPITNTIIDVSITGGSLNISNGTTDSNGNFKIVFKAPDVTTIQTFNITATASNTNFIGTAIGSTGITVNPVSP